MNVTSTLDPVVIVLRCLVLWLHPCTIGKTLRSNKSSYPVRSTRRLVREKRLDTWEEVVQPRSLWHRDRSTSVHLDPDRSVRYLSPLRPTTESGSHRLLNTGGKNWHNRGRKRRTGTDTGVQRKVSVTHLLSRKFLVSVFGLSSSSDRSPSDDYHRVTGGPVVVLLGQVHPHFSWRTVSLNPPSLLTLWQWILNTLLPVNLSDTDTHPSSIDPRRTEIPVWRHRRSQGSSGTRPSTSSTEGWTLVPEVGRDLWGPRVERVVRGTETQRSRGGGRPPDMGQPRPLGKPPDHSGLLRRVLFHELIFFFFPFVCIVCRW